MRPLATSFAAFVTTWTGHNARLGKVGQCRQEWKAHVLVRVLSAQDGTGEVIVVALSRWLLADIGVKGVQNLYDRMDRMHDLGPAFIDVTWGAGGHLSNLTVDMVKVAQSVYGLETCMHLTCTDMEKTKVDDALREAYNTGCTNILALRGDPPREKEKWEAKEGGFRYARDLVKYIKEQYGDHFDIGVAGYPEGCDDQDDQDLLVDHLKEKIDAGGTFIVSQMCYDADIFIAWVKKCREKGINVPIIPGIMPIHTHAAFLRRANWTKCHIPDEWTEALEPVKNDDVAVRKVGAKLVADMCRKMVDSGIRHLHL